LLDPYTHGQLSLVAQVAPLGCVTTTYGIRGGSFMLLLRMWALMFPFGPE
jgi:hypothetical protein